VSYKRFLPSESVSFHVNDHLVECGQTTWQIRNIAATSAGRRVLTVREPEPIFNELEPKLVLNFKAMAIWAVVAFVVGAAAGGSFLGIIASIAVIGVQVFLRNQALVPARQQWQAQKDETVRRWAVWDEMRKNPPILFSLMLETNAGSKPLFYSFDESQINKGREAIKRAMEKKETGDVSFNIETVNVGAEDSINNFGSEIYQQKVESI
jgi:hypothetical protein